MEEQGRKEGMKETSEEGMREMEEERTYKGNDVNMLEYRKEIEKIKKF